MKSRHLWKSLTAGVLAAVLVGMLAVSVPSEVRAASSDEIRSQLDAMESEKAAIQAQLAALEQQRLDNLTEIEDAVTQKNNIDRQIVLLVQEIDNINRQISAYNVLIADKQDELDEAEARLERLREQNRERIRTMEEEGTLTIWSVLFKANSFADLLDRMSMIEEIAEADHRRLEEMRQAADEVNLAKQELAARKEELESTRAELNASQTELDARQLESEELLQELLSRGEAYQALLESGKDEMNALLAEIARQEEAYNQAKQAEYEQWLATSKPPETTEPEETKPEETKPEQPEDPPEDDPQDTPSSEGWVIPCSYVYVSSPFSTGRQHPILGYVRPHNGIDLAAYQGNPVYATKSGTVTTASVGDEPGNYVVINHHDGFSSVYMHMSYYVVSAGEQVRAGQVIGYVGSTGLSEGPHLHFGIMLNGTYVNPADYMPF